MYTLELADLYPHFVILFFSNDTATTEIYTLSLHDALPIFNDHDWVALWVCSSVSNCSSLDRKSTRLNSSHLGISYAVFCLKKKKIRLCRGTGHRLNCRLRGSWP